MEEDAIPAHGHITSLAVLRTHRKCGIATLLMKQAHARMQEAFGSEYCSLHVRYTNMAAFHLYSQTLGYKIDDIEKGYYADGEDAYSMKCVFEKSEDSKKKTTKKKKVGKAGNETAAMADMISGAAEMRMDTSDQPPPSDLIAEDNVEGSGEAVKANPTIGSSRISSIETAAGGESDPEGTS